MRARVISDVAWSLPNGQLARPGEVLDTEACGVAEPQLRMLTERGYLAPAEPEAKTEAAKAPRKG